MKQSVIIGHYENGRWVQDGPWFDQHTSESKADGYSYVQCKSPFINPNSLKTPPANLTSKV